MIAFLSSPFAQKRKTLWNNLTARYRRRSDAALEDQIKLTVRAEPCFQRQNVS